MSSGKRLHNKKELTSLSWVIIPSTITSPTLAVLPKRVSTVFSWGERQRIQSELDQTLFSQARKSPTQDMVLHKHTNEPEDREAHYKNHS